MSDLPDRFDKEDEIAAILAAIFARYSIEFEQWAAEQLQQSSSSPFGPITVELGQPPQALIDALKREIVDELTQSLAGIHYEAAVRLADEIGASLTDDARDEAVAAALEYGQQRANEIADSLAARFVDNIANVATAAAAVAVVSSVLGESRPGIVAATETTRANTFGEMTEKELIESELGLQVEAVWRTEQDSRVCPFCEPLDGVPESEWPDDAGYGPPRHPNCRCYLEHVPIENAASSDIDLAAFT